MNDQSVARWAKAELFNTQIGDLITRRLKTYCHGPVKMPPTGLASLPIDAAGSRLAMQCVFWLRSGFGLPNALRRRRYPAKTGASSATHRW
jgi:hypothetical protein